MYKNNGKKPTQNEVLLQTNAVLDEAVSSMRSISEMFKESLSSMRQLREQLQEQSASFSLMVEELKKESDIRDQEHALLLKECDELMASVTPAALAEEKLSKNTYAAAIDQHGLLNTRTATNNDADSGDNSYPKNNSLGN